MEIKHFYKVCSYRAKTYHRFLIYDAEVFVFDYQHKKNYSLISWTEFVNRRKKNLWTLLVI